MYTLYGFITTIAVIVALSFINNITNMDIVKLVSILIISTIIQPFFCKPCINSYSLAAYLASVPLLISVLFDCEKIRMLIFALASGIAIGRIACYFSGCCSGKISDASLYSIKYEKGSVIADHLHKTVYVYPTILLEILAEFAIAFVVLNYKYGLELFGILNIILLQLTSWWRYTPRVGGNIWVSLLSLIFYTFIVYFKQCNNFKPNIEFNLKPISLVIGFIFGLIVSNDIYMGDLIKMTIYK
jgi:hypothetical protein